MFKKKQISIVVGQACVAIAMVAAGTSAQAQATAAAADTSRITVTGTRIQSQAVTASSPVIEIGAEEFKVSGAVRVEDLVNQYPQLENYFDNFNNNGAQGYPTVDLRGLSATRTLTLINGHRLPPGDSEVRDVSLIPAAMLKRVDVLTGGASAVYGSDAVAGVVNFVMDDKFEGLSINIGNSAFRHDNSTEYLRTKMDARGFKYPSGNSGFDGEARNIDIAIGSSFANGGHAQGWLSYRRNNPLQQGARDYSSCALNDGGTACGGSATAPNPNFYIYDVNGGATFGGYAHMTGPGVWVNDGAGPAATNLYNYAPINYYQRPEERTSAGGMVKFKLNDYVEPYFDLMVSNRTSVTQIAESGTFFADTIRLTCDGSATNPPGFNTGLCATLLTAGETYDIYVGKRNAEGGPRIFTSKATTFRIVAGSEGMINKDWRYNASWNFGKSSSTQSSTNDFLADRTVSALSNCPAGSFAGCVPYDVWTFNGVTPAAAAGLQGVGVRTIDTSQLVLNAYVSGLLPFSLPAAKGERVKLVAGFEKRVEEFERVHDSNSIAGNFTGNGGPRLGVFGEITTKEFFLESSVPILKDAGFFKKLDLELGYRISDYSTAGKTDTYKVAFVGDLNAFRVRGGFNHAVRAPGMEELFATQGISLWGGGDICRGTVAQVTARGYTAAQCANTFSSPAVAAAQFGSVSGSPASQYNQLSGGNPNLKPESADTWTIGFSAAPIKGMQISMDYWSIKIEDTIRTIGADTILKGCATTGDPKLCGYVVRNTINGNLWLGDDNVDGFVRNLTGNNGSLHFKGIDLGASYTWPMLGGRMMTSLNGSYTLNKKIDPVSEIQGDDYDCAKRVNSNCQSPQWRHIASARFSKGSFSTNVRWRYIGEMSYIESTGRAGTTDTLVVAAGGKLKAENYFDLGGSYSVTDNLEISVGVNNIFDKEPPMVGATLASNANAPSGYDQAGRFFFTNLGFKF